MEKVGPVLCFEWFFTFLEQWQISLLPVCRYMYGMSTGSIKVDLQCHNTYDLPSKAQPNQLLDSCMVHSKEPTQPPPPPNFYLHLRNLVEFCHALQTWFVVDGSLSFLNLVRNGRMTVLCIAQHETYFSFISRSIFTCVSV